MAEAIARRDEFQGLHVTVQLARGTDEIEVRLYDPTGRGAYSVDMVPGQCTRLSAGQFGAIIAESAEKVLANLRAFQRGTTAVITHYNIHMAAMRVGLAVTDEGNEQFTLHLGQVTQRINVCGMCPGDLPAFLAPILAKMTPSPECPCGIHRSRCDYHAVLS